MAYESVLWTAKTPITADRLAQMQENIDELRAKLEGNQQYISGAPMGAGRGIMWLQEFNSNITVPHTSFVQIGDSFVPKTEEGRRYLFEAYFPRVHSYSAVVVFQFFKNTEEISSFVIGPNSSAQEAFIHGFAAGFFADSGHGMVHLAPGFSTTNSYSVKAIAYLNGTDAQIAASSTLKPFIKFSDIGPDL